MNMQLARKAFIIAFAIGLFCAAKTGRAGQEKQAEQVQVPPVTGLGAVFTPGPILQDRNGDGQIDFVAARIIVPNTPAPEDIAAAVAVAGRLGFETSGLSFPLVFRASEITRLEDGPPAIIIGTDNEHLPEALAKRLEQLEEGCGIAAYYQGLVVIAGKDPEGTKTAGEAFAARSPYLWRVIGREKGETFERLAADATKVLRQGDVEALSVSFEELVYRKKKKEVAEREIASVRFSVDVPAGASSRARDLIAALAWRHRRGEDTKLLNYACAGEVVVRVDDGQESHTVTVPRVGVPSSYLRGSPEARRQAQTGRGQRAGARGGAGARAAAGRTAAGRTFDLADLFSVSNGLLKDSDGDKIPDNTDMLIVFPQKSSPPGDFPAIGTVQLAARIGLESTGISFPLLGFDKDLKNPDSEARPLVLIGRQNRLVRELTRVGKLREPEPAPGQGRIEMTPNAYRGNSAVVLTGGDVAGEEAAAQYLSRRAPFVWNIGRGEPTLKDVKNGVRKMLTGRSTAAQAALALLEVEEILDGLEDEDKELEKLSVSAFFEEAAPEFDKWLAGELRYRLGLDEIEVKSQRRYDPVEVFQDTPELEWEVDAFWKALREKALPEIREGARVSVEVRVSESPELRQALTEQIRAELTKQGAEVEKIDVICAYKQGLSWLMDVVVPELRNKSVARVQISWKPLAVDPQSKQRFQNEPARWLNELYPADDVLAQKLQLPLEAFTFVMQEEGEAIYSVIAKNETGEMVHHDSFSPKTYDRPFFSEFPDYATVMVTTGWVKVVADGETILDERIATDLDRIWDHYQDVSLKKINKHVKANKGARPYFHTLRVEIKASEPDYLLGIDEEQVSALESLHEDIYFDTLDFFAEAAKQASGSEVNSRSMISGTVLPWIHPERRGQAPELTVTFSRFASKEPLVAVTYLTKETEEEKKEREKKEQEEAEKKKEEAETKELEAEAKKEEQKEKEQEDEKAQGRRGGRRGARGDDRQKKDDEPEKRDKTTTKTLSPMRTPDSYLNFAEVQDGVDGLSRLGFLVNFDDPALLLRVATMLDNLTKLQENGMFKEAFGFHDIAAVTVRLESPGTVSSRTYVSRPAPKPPTAAPEPYQPGQQLVTWEHIIGVEESERITHTLGTLPQVTAFVGGRSYQGRPVSAMELKQPMEAELVSQAKLNTWKPVLLLVGRQHANEVSSTLHLLRMAELLATDPEYQKFLKKINVVILPIANPDGTALVTELQKLTPRHMLHAGRYSALGADVSAQTNPDTLLTEGLVWGELSNRWVADIYLNLHGCPSHEWVQHFTNYNPKNFRSFWLPRGWYTSIRAVIDPRLKTFADINQAMMDYIAEEVTGDPESRESNQRIHDRYIRWSVRWQPFIYNLEIYKDTAIYYKQSRGLTQLARPDSMVRTMAFSGYTEALDETAQGAWLDLQTRMGFGYVRAALRFLEEADYELVRLEGESGGKVRLGLIRPRPIRPGKKERN